MKSSKGFNFSLRVVMLIVMGLIAALTVIAFLGDGADMLSDFANTSTESGGFFDE